MANNFGQFAGNFADSLTRSLTLKKESDRRDALAKQQAKLVELQLASGQIKLDANTKLADIMTGTRTQLELGDIDEEGLGTFRPTGANVETPNAPQSLVDVLAGGDPRGQVAALQSGAVSGGDILDFQTQQDQLSASQGLFDNMPFDEAGNPMLIPVGLSIDASTGRAVQQFGANPEFNSAQQGRASKETFAQLVTDAFEVADIESEQTGSFLESGFPFAEQAETAKATLGTVAGVFGFGDTAEEQSADVASRNRVEKLYGLILNKRLDKLMESDPNLTNTQIEQQQTISPSTDKKAGANLLLIADFMQEELINAEVEGIKIPSADRKRALDFIRKARGGELLGEQAAPVIDVPEIARMTRAELDGLDFSGMSAEMIQAVEDRLKELK